MGLIMKQAMSGPAVWKGQDSVVKLGRPEGVVVSVPVGEGGRLKTQILRPDPLVAPLQQGQSLGMLRVTNAAGAVVADKPLLVLETVEESGLIGRAWDSLRLWIK